jgi:hypothetical protein
MYSSAKVFSLFLRRSFSKEVGSDALAFYFGNCRVFGMKLRIDVSYS